MGLAGLLNLGIHPDALTKLLSQNSAISPAGDSVVGSKMMIARSLRNSSAIASQQE